MWPGKGVTACTPRARLTLVDEVLLELLQEFQIEQVLRSERLLPHHCLHGLHVFPDGIASILGEGENGPAVTAGVSREPIGPQFG